MSEKMLEAMELVLEEQGIDVTELESLVSEDTTLKEDLSLDDNGILNLVMALESRYELSVSDEAIKESKTIGDLIKIVEDKLE